jgi:hypothetical protein
MTEQASISLFYSYIASQNTDLLCAFAPLREIKFSRWWRKAQSRSSS